MYGGTPLSRYFPQEHRALEPHSTPAPVHPLVHHLSRDLSTAGRCCSSGEGMGPSCRQRNSTPGSLSRYRRHCGRTCSHQCLLHSTNLSPGLVPGRVDVGDSLSSRPSLCSRRRAAVSARGRAIACQMAPKTHWSPSMPPFSALRNLPSFQTGLLWEVLVPIPATTPRHTVRGISFTIGSFRS